MKILLETDAYSDWRQNGRWGGEIETAFEVLVPRTARRAENETNLRKFFLRQAGALIPENDIWIAALAVEHGIPLATSDSHFDHLPQVARVME